MIITILSPDNRRWEWEVWAHLEQGDPIDQNEAFIVGVGSTKTAAIREATRTLRQAISDLEAAE